MRQSAVTSKPGLRSRHPLAVLVLALGIIVIGVTGLAFGSAIIGSVPTTTTQPTAGDQANWWLSEAGIDRATRFRQQARLPATEYWVRQVASNPEALANLPRYGVPLTSAEVALLAGRAKTISDVRRVVDRFAAAHPEAWAGDYTDGGQLVAMIADPSGSLSDELRTGVDPNAPLLIKSARWSLRDLQALKERVLHDFWLSAGYHLLDLGVNVQRNLVELEVSSADTAVAATIADHFGAGDQLVVTIDGTGVAALPTGTIVGRAVDQAGNPAVGLAVELVGDSPGARSNGDVGVETADDGSFVFHDVPATAFQVTVLSQVDRQGGPLAHSDWRLVGSAYVEVKPGESTEVRIVVQRP